MQKRETLAQLIRRTVFEFEQRQAARLSPESHLGQGTVCSHMVQASQPQPQLDLLDLPNIP
jgi:hypothetical protein